jgi:hypothetical protein
VVGPAVRSSQSITPVLGLAEVPLKMLRRKPSGEQMRKVVNRTLRFYGLARRKSVGKQ